MLKTCSNCGIELTPETKYPKVNNKLCRPCNLAYLRARYHLTKEENKEYVKQYQTSPKGREVLNNATKRMHQKYPEKYAARVKLREAVRKGEIIKSPYCQKESLTDVNCTGRIEAHHHLGYGGEHWKDVMWLCVSHHKKMHKQTQYRSKYLAPDPYSVLPIAWWPEERVKRKKKEIKYYLNK